MPNHRTPLANREYYHVFNRGVARNPVFLSKHDYEQALLALSYYLSSTPPMKLSRFKELSVEERGNVLEGLQGDTRSVEIVSFVLMPNHFHLLLRQTSDDGISTFMSKFTNSYTRYFNTKHQRVGPLFQGVFKAIHVEDDEQLLHLSRYIHLNPVASFVIHEKDLFTYPWSSLPAFLNEKTSFVETAPVLEHFRSREDYRTFLLDQIGYAKELEKIKHLTLENH
jgi:putative transposase